MEQNLLLVAKRVWETVRFIYFMLKRGISKRQLLLDLNLTLKRSNRKIATKAKAFSNLMFHHHHHDSHRDGDVVSSNGQLNEYEFSCTTTPMYSLPFHLNKRRRHGHGDHQDNCSSRGLDAPPSLEDDVTSMNPVTLALEMLHNNNEVAVDASPMLPGFGRSPTGRQLRITDSPFPLRGSDDDNGIVDKKAEEFIERFYRQLRQQA